MPFNDYFGPYEPTPEMLANVDTAKAGVDKAMGDLRAVSNEYFGEETPAAVTPAPVEAVTTPPSPADYFPKPTSMAYPLEVGAQGVEALGRSAKRMVGAVGETAKNLLGLPGTAATLASGALNPNREDPVAAAGREAWKSIGLSTEEYFGKLAEKPGETLRGTAGTAIGGPNVGEFFRTGDPSAIAAAPERTALDVILNAPVTAIPLAGATASLASKARGPLAAIPGGSTIIKAADIIGSKAIPKYNWSDEFLALDAQRQGEMFYRTVTQTKPAALDTAKIMIANPEAAPFIAPQMKVSPANLKLLDRSYRTFMDRQQAASPTGPYPEFEFNKRGLNVKVDNSGYITYGKAADFDKMDPEQLRKTINIRTMIDANHQLMWERGILTDQEYQTNSFGYLRTTYRAFQDPAEWAWQLKNNPKLQPVIQEAYDYFAKRMKDPLNPSQPANPEQIENQMWATLRQASVLREDPSLAAVRGPIDAAYAALIKRKNVPPPIAKLLGPMEDEFMAVRVGQTLDMQNRILLGDAMMSRASRMASANDGRPLIIPHNPNVAPAFRDYYTLEGGENNPIWGRKWNQAQVHPDIIDAIRTVENPQITGAVARALELWKTSKVANNPPSHINNIMGDMIFTHYAGASIFNPMNAGYYVKAWNDVTDFLLNGTLSPDLERGMRSGAVIPGFASAEMGADYAKVIRPTKIHNVEQLITHLMVPSDTPVLGKAAEVQQAISRIYDLEDQLFRYGAWLKHRADGKSDIAAQLEVTKAFPSYETTSPAGKFLRGQAPLPGTGVGMGVGALIGGPFTSFPLEVTRIHMTAAREHPIRFMTANMIPLALTATGMGASGMTIQDYHDMLDRQPPYQRGKLLVPVPTGKGEPGLIDLTQAWPMADWLQHRGLGAAVFGRDVPTPFPQGLVTSGPGWSLLEMMNNINSSTGQPIADPNKGEGWGTLMGHVLQTLAPVPPSAINLYGRVKAGVQGTPYTKYEAEPQSLVRAPFQSLAPQLGNWRNLSDIQKEAAVVRRGRLGAEKKGLRSIGRDKTLTDQEREDARQRSRDERTRIREGLK